MPGHPRLLPPGVSLSEVLRRWNLGAPLSFDRLANSMRAILLTMNQVNGQALGSQTNVLASWLLYAILWGGNSKGCSCPLSGGQMGSTDQSLKQIQSEQRVWFVSTLFYTRLYISVAVVRIAHAQNDAPARVRMCICKFPNLRSSQGARIFGQGLLRKSSACMVVHLA